ncbi:MAG: DEAD/DEAH box helicase [Peptostreptococcaceae bacterium]|nr:DEAD/DEAH box helicase [Peptostreptococcaceae bacterium]
MTKLDYEIPNFIFTENGFQIDYTTLEPEKRASAQKIWHEKGYDSLYRLGFQVERNSLNESAAFLVSIVEIFFELLTKTPEVEIARENTTVHLDEMMLHRLLTQTPFVIGAEYVSEAWIQKIIDGLTLVFADEIRNYKGKVESYLAQKSNGLHTPERIFFHLVESKEPDYPFAFLATYATKNASGKVSHMPLEYALVEFKNSREKLMDLLSCLNNVAKTSDLIASFMESGELFWPIKITTDEAYAFLKQIESIEASGVLCRIPNWWRRQSSSIQKTIKIGEKEPSKLGFDTLISVTPTLTVDGEELTKSDIEKILRQSEGLVFLKGKWIEVNHERLRKLLSDMENMDEKITLFDALRIDEQSLNIADDSTVISNGKWLSSLMNKLTHPESIKELKLPKSLNAKLRPYQMNGYKWLNYMSDLQFGACLADDMGLGKTVQTLSYLENIRQKHKNAEALLIVPASLLGNWEREIKKFTPSMDYNILHGKSAKELSEQILNKKSFLTITTYKMVSRLNEILQKNWDVLILDEAQAIKNPTTKQTKLIKKIRATMRIAMTGTPIENDLSNLWSLFDFLNGGLLGTASEFKKFCRGLKEEPQKYVKLKNMIAPFILRRVKTDKSIISDLPEKMEFIDYVGLSKKQIVLYKKVVADMEKKISTSEGMSRKGLILTTIMKLKQICNHPDQYLGQEGYLESESGKFDMLRELCETIYEKRERVLIFTQFQEIADFLAEFLRSIFNTEGFVLHGATPIKQRNKMVEEFQSERYVPFMVLSVKAGGTGLNLTNANHVIHFDRWWNPAVENQATDRAYRIGQNKNVMVHKLVCKDTIEEKINELIESKKALAEQMIGAGEDKVLTEMSDEEILDLLRLDL